MWLTRGEHVCTSWELREIQKVLVWKQSYHGGETQPFFSKQESLRFFIGKLIHFWMKMFFFKGVVMKTLSQLQHLPLDVIFIRAEWNNRNPRPSGMRMHIDQTLPLVCDVLWNHSWNWNIYCLLKWVVEISDAENFQKWDNMRISKQEVVLAFKNLSISWYLFFRHCRNANLEGSFALQIKPLIMYMQWFLLKVGKVY